MARKLSASAEAEQAAIVAEIAQARSFSAHLRMGPHEKYTTRDIPSAAEAFEAADELVRQYSRYSRRAMVFAINTRGRETLVTRELAQLAGVL